MRPGGLGGLPEASHSQPLALQVPEPEPELGAWELVVSLKEGGAPLPHFKQGLKLLYCGGRRVLLRAWLVWPQPLAGPLEWELEGSH